jgi:hypothetical protein
LSSGFAIEMLGWILKPLALASTVALSTLGLLGRKYQKARFIFHLTFYVSALGAVSVWGVVVSLLATLAGQVSDGDALHLLDRVARERGADRQGDHFGGRRRLSLD